MKKFIVFLLAVLVLCMPLTALAESGSKRLVDGADLLTESEETAMLARLDEISAEFEYDVVVVTTKSLGTKSAMKFAQDTFKDGNYGMGDEKSGVILIVSTQDREWYIEFFGEERLTEGTALSDYFLDDLVDGDYYGAFSSFAEAAYEELRFSFGGNLVMWLVIGLVIAFIVVSSMKAQLKSVHSQDHAREYVREGSFKLEHSRDLFLYSTVSRVARPKNTSSSGGRSGGGGGGSRGGGGRF